MSKLYIWLLLAATLPHAFGQGNPCPDSVGISTDPRTGKGYNNERGPSPSFVNTFNWMDSVYSPTQFAADVFEAAQITVRQMGKIEELYLHVIALSGRIAELEAQLNQAIQTDESHE